MTEVINFFRDRGHLPSQHKLGKLFPVYKKLNLDNPYNHHGITILDIFCKLYEKLLKKPLYIKLLDVKTAFDVVWHESLLRKLYLDGIQGGLWMGVKSLYSGAKSAISWEGTLTDTFPVLQGVRQGAVLSADLYKRFNNPLLNMLTNSGQGGHIGINPVQSPTCADDIALCSQDKVEMQCMIDIVHQREKYEIQPRKSAVA